MSVDGRPGDPRAATPDVTAQSIRVRCRVEWLDTDASGHYHHSTVIRWVEAAEAELFRRLGIASLYGSIPRVYYEANYVSRVWFGDEVDLELTIDEVGRSSLHMSFVASAGDRRPVARGRVVIVNAPADSGHALPWPAHVRAALVGPS